MKKHWITLALVAVIIILAVTAAFFLSRPQGDALFTSVKMLADRRNESTGGVELDSSFSLTTGYRITAAEVRQMLVTQPEIAFEVSGKNGKNWKITPAEPLHSNEVYTFGVQNLQGVTVQSFAFQTISDLMVSSTYPADGMTYVTPDSGIEITFNASQVDLQQHFEIQPPVSGQFLTRDFTTIFQPDQPLEDGSIYRVSVKAGAAAANGQQLMEDYQFTFETGDAASEKWDYTQLQLAGDFSETFLTGDPLAIRLSAGSNLRDLTFTTSIYRYPNIEAYEAEIKAHDAFYRERIGSKRTFYRADSSVLEQVASFEGTLFKKSEYSWELFDILPDDLSEGFYLVEISGKSAEGHEQFVQKLLQLRNLSIYTQSVNGNTLVWANDPATGEPLAGRGIRLEDVETGAYIDGTTQSDGTVNLRTNEMSKAYISVLEGSRNSYFATVELAQKQESQLAESYYTAIYTDREIYQPEDTIQFWGVVRPRRATASLPGNVTVSLGDWEESFQQTVVSVQEDGTFHGELTYRAIGSDYYRLSVSDGERDYLSKYLQITEYTKPAYVIEVTTDKPFYYANEQVQFFISANYYDGTPVANGKLALSAYDLGLEAQPVNLDAQGKATVSAMYQNNRGEPQSWQPANIWYGLYSGDEQDIEVQKQGRVLILPSTVAAKAEHNRENGELLVRTARLDTTRLTEREDAYWGGFEQLRGADVDLPLRVQVIRNEWVEIPTGSYYDEINKRTITQYRIEQRTDTVDTLSARTSGGRATLDVSEYLDEDKVSYSFRVLFDGGVLGDVCQDHRNIGIYDDDRQSGTRYSFRALENDEFGMYRAYTSGSFAIGEEIPLGLYRNNQPVTNEGKVLFTIVQQGIVKHDVYGNSPVSIRMEEDYLPNFTIAGAYFDGRHVYAMEHYPIQYNSDSRKLQLELDTAGEGPYRPGDEVEILLTVTDANGQPAEMASAVIGVVDESVFALRGQQLDLRGQLYKDVFYPQIAEAVSYVEYELENADMATGGKGGGGGEGGYIRQDFRDTALFQTVQTDAQGKASASFRLPDNIASWRITAAAVTRELAAGDSTTNTVATLPFYVRPLFTDSYLVGDDLSVSVLVGGTALPELDGQEVSYTATIINEAGSTIDSLTETGAIGQRIPLNFGKYDAGNYQLKIIARCGEYTDTVQHPLSVIARGLALPVLETLDIKQVGQISSVRYPVRMVVYDARLKPYMEALEHLSKQDGDRTEMIAASYMAQLAYNELLAPEEQQKIRRDVRLDERQQEAAGVRPLALAEPSVATTAKMLVACPDLVKKAGAQQLFEETLRDPAATPDERIMAYVGMAALKKPVLLDLNLLLQGEGDTLSDAQKLWVGVGLAAMGDYTSAQKIYEAFSPKLTAEGRLKYVSGGSLDAQIETTAAALALTAMISHEDATPLVQFFLERENDRSKTDNVLYNLEMLLYTERFRRPQDGEKARFRYTSGGAQTEVELGDLGVKTMVLGEQALKEANFETISGHVYAAVSYLSDQEPVELLDTDKVTLEKTYTVVGGGALHSGGRVRVDLKMQFDESAPDGCYDLTDYLPAGLRYMTNQTNDYQGIDPDNHYWYRLRQDGQTLRFLVYRSTKEPAAVYEEVGRPNPGTEGEMDSQQSNPNEFTISYYASAALTGEFVIESAYVTPHMQGIAAKTERGSLTVE